MNTKQHNTQATFASLLRQYEQQASNRTQATEKEYTQALQTLATAVTHSVLKKCIQTSGNMTLASVKRDVVTDAKLLEGLEYTQANAYKTICNAEGEKVTITTDEDYAAAYSKLCKTAFGEGLDLVNTAIVAIMTETEKAKERNGNNLPPEFMEATYEIRRLKRKVWIKTGDSVDGWETVATSPIREIYKSVRRMIEQSRATQTDNRNGYTYLQETARDEQSNTDDIIYRRLPKYADLGGYACDFNGKEISYSASPATVANVDILIERLNLSKQQAQILQLRLSGYGYKAIATYFGVKGANIQTQIKRIQQKAAEIGLKPITQ